MKNIVVYSKKKLKIGDQSLSLEVDANNAVYVRLEYADINIEELPMVIEWLNKARAHCEEKESKTLKKKKATSSSNNKK